MMSQSALAILERAPQIEETTMPSFLGDLPHKAADLLGYDLLWKRMESQALKKALAETNTRPFTKESVEKYKEEITKNANRYLFLDRVAHVALNASMLLISFCSGPAILGWFVSWKIGLTFLCGLVVSLVINIRLEGYTVKQPGSWQVTPLKGYAEPVPEFVLHQAVELKEALPEAGFFVHQFVQNGLVLDPFLVISHGNESCFIAVWDEPKFEAKQKV
jgi:hypothetical protein